MTSNPQYAQEKFEVLNLPQLWEEAAAHVDFHLSDPGSCSYKTDMGERWRTLQPATQRSFVVVAVKKAESLFRTKAVRRVSSTEAYVMLLNNVCELLWILPSHNLTPASRKLLTETINGVTRRSTLIRLPAVAEDDEEPETTVVPLSAAWQYSSSVPIPLTRREASSADSRLTTVDEMEEQNGSLDDSDSCSDWSIHS